MNKTYLLLTGFLALMASFSVNAVSISPVKMEIASGKNVAAIELTNTDEVAHTYDLRVFKWLGTGPQGAIVEPAVAQNIVTSRPVINIPAKSKAIIRLSIISRSDAPAEYYRIFVKNISPVANINGTAKLSVSMSMPFQITNRKSAKGDLTTLDSETVINSGSAAVFVRGVRNGDKITNDTRYILPGESWKTKNKLADLVWVSGIQ